MKILLAHDDIYAADVTAFMLLRDGHTVSLAYLCEAATRLADERFDLTLVEAGVDSVPALAVCRTMRLDSDVPIILVVDDASEGTLVAGYECGVDDVVVRPVGPRHLRLRIEAVVRRVARPTWTVAGPGRVSVADLVVDSAGFQVHKNGHTLPFTRLELRILHMLVLHAGTVVSVQQLAGWAWESGQLGDTGLLKTHISHIRHKLAEAGGDHLSIRAIPRTGYVLEGQPVHEPVVPLFAPWAAQTVPSAVSGGYRR